ncbi:MAG: hypothetical protein QXY49_03925 [Thermofilaceae archaeon]
MEKLPIRFGYALEEDSSKLFYCWVRESLANGRERFRPDDPRKYWKVSWEERTYTEFEHASLVRPPGLTTLSLRSRSVFKYGVFQLSARLPPWKEDSPMLWFGFEAEDLFGGGVVHFLYHKGKLRSFAGAWPAPLSFELPCLPEDYHVRRHIYTVKVHSTLALWFIDDKLRGVSALMDSGEGVLVHEGPPYSCGITPMRPVQSMGILLDIDGGPIDREWAWDDLHPWQIRVLEGDPRPSIAMKLYRYASEKTLEGVIEDSVASHPIPCAGSRVTLAFKADACGRLSAEAYTLKGEWGNIDSFEVQANKAIYWTLEVGSPFIRLCFEPKSSGSITLAEAFIT